MIGLQNTLTFSSVTYEYALSYPTLLVCASNELLFLSSSAGPYIRVVSPGGRELSRDLISPGEFNCSISFAPAHLKQIAKTVNLINT